MHKIQDLNIIKLKKRDTQLAIGFTLRYNHTISIEFKYSLSLSLYIYIYIYTPSLKKQKG
jgi:hypothetical protein